MKTDVRIRPFETRMALNEALTERLGWEIESSGKGAMALMLAGGTTPLYAYQALGARKLAPSGALELLFSAERYVPATSEARQFPRCATAGGCTGVAGRAGSSGAYGGCRSIARWKTTSGDCGRW
ncbi:MAG: 6-phosphogluconolactonase [Gammaproteobacteria bacterium]